MKPLIIGSGAREHAIAWKFSKSKRISGLYIGPGNAGTADLGENIPDFDPLNMEKTLRIIRDRGINIVFVGPETPLSAGIADFLTDKNIPVIGPNQESAQLESSKAFSKRFMNKHAIPTPVATEFHDIETFTNYIRNSSGKMVLKKSGLASGKGVLESENREQCLEFGTNVLQEDVLLVEEYLEGFEISVFTVTDGKHHLILPPCADFKKSGKGDTGLNTGGMGSICPVPGISKSLMERVINEVVEPTFNGLRKDNLDYKGILYFGLMITEKGPFVLEYNIRLGDPEAQVLLPLIDSDFGNLTDAICQQKLDSFPLRLSEKSAVGVVVAASGYPEKYEKAIPVTSLPHSKGKSLLVFHATTGTDEGGKIRTGGGRCFTIVGLHSDPLHAQMLAYKGAEEVLFEGAWYRPDIGNKFFY